LAKLLREVAKILKDKIYMLKKALSFLFFLLIFFSIKNYGQKMHSSKAKIPPAVNSNEANKEQLVFAKAEGDSISNCIKWILSEAGNSAGQVRAGEYKITYAITAPEGWYEYNNKEVNWVTPVNANAHFWIFIQDGADGRIVSDLNITASVMNEKKELVEQKPIPFAWMPLINGYGNNLQFSADGNYEFQLKILPPFYHRHDPYNGDRFTKMVTAVIPISIRLKNIPATPLSEKMEAQTRLSKTTGDAYKNTLKEMFHQATDGKDTVSGDYFIAVADEYAEGHWFYKENKFVYMIGNEQSAKQNAHVEVAVCDAKTGRFLHDLNVVVTLYKGDQKISMQKVPFMWHPWLYHYGLNWRVPAAGKNYRFMVHFDPPAYRRYGKNMGKQFTNPVDIEFDNLTIKTGQK
jgi:uncharacterized protein involved in high-affinity Fe2+ transport